MYSDMATLPRIMVLAALAVAAVGANDAEISGDINHLAWNMLLFKPPMKGQDSKHMICGATLIQPKYFVTAAHCVTAPSGKDQDEYVSGLELAIGKKLHTLEPAEPGQQIRKIQKLHFQNYEGASSHWKNDIALGELDEAVVLGNGMEPACVDWDHKLPPIQEGDWGMVPSWGSDKPASAGHSLDFNNPLRITRMQYLSPATCKAQASPGLRPLAEIEDKFCATNGTLRPGDAGFGMFNEGDGLLYLTGIVSAGGPGQSKPTDVEFFTNTTMFIDWMASHISPLTKQPCGSITLTSA